MCTNGSRSAIDTPWNARRTGKPSPSRSLGAVSTPRTRRGRELGVGARDARERGQVLDGDGRHAWWNAGRRAVFPVAPTRAAARRYVGVSAPLGDEAERALERRGRGEQERLGSRAADERQADGQAVDEPHRHRRDRPARDRRRAADARVRRGVPAEGEVVLPRRAVGGGDDEVDARERRLEARRGRPREVALPCRVRSSSDARPPAPRRALEELVAEVAQLDVGVGVLVGDHLGERARAVAAAPARYAVRSSDSSQSSTVSSSSSTSLGAAGYATSVSVAPARLEGADRRVEERVGPRVRREQRRRRADAEPRRRLRRRDRATPVTPGEHLVEERDVGDRPRHRSGAVLARRDRHDAGPSGSCRRWA